MQVASSFLPRVASRQVRNATCVLVFARGNATSTANAPQTKRDGKGPLTGGINFGTLLTERANKFEHKDLLVIPGEDVRNTFIEVQKKVDAFATGLHELHIVAGDSFVAALPDTSQNLFLALGTIRAGITYIPFSPTAPLDNILGAVKAHKAKAVVVPDLLANREYIQELYDAIPELDIQRKDFLTPFTPLKYPSLKYAVVWSPEKKEYHGFKDYNDIPATRTPFRNPLPKMASIPTDKPALLLPQKDSLNFDAISQAALVNTGHAILEALSVTIQDRVSFAVPYSSLGFYLAAGSISHGNVLIQANKVFDATATLKTISRDRATILFIGANNLGQVVNAASKSKHDLSTLRTIVIVGRGDSNAKQQATQLGAKQVFGIDQVANGVFAL